jgi:hypothetical protein
MRGFNEKLFGDKLVAGQLPTQLGLIGSQVVGDFLLDFYPNAAVAYSLRKLRLLYTGNAIRVRRSSDNTEQDIGFSALGNLDTSSLTSFCGSGNGFVTTWYDQSGNARNATQTTASLQPQIVNNGSVIVDNGKVCIDFNLDITKKWQLISSNVQFSTSLSFATVFNTTYATNFMKIWSAGADETTTGYAFVSQNLSSKIVSLAGNGYLNTSPPFISSNTQVFNDGTQYLAYGDLNSSSSNFFKNNTEISYDVRTMANTDNRNIPIYISGGTFGTQGIGGKMQELIIYASNQSSNRNGINTNINSYYAIY